MDNHPYQGKTPFFMAIFQRFPWHLMLGIVCMQLLDEYQRYNETDKHSQRHTTSDVPGWQIKTKLLNLNNAEWKHAECLFEI